MCNYRKVFACTTSHQIFQRLRAQAIHTPLNFLPERVDLLTRRRQDENELLPRVQDGSKPIVASLRQHLVETREFRAGSCERVTLASTPGIVTG